MRRLHDTASPHRKRHADDRKHDQQHAAEIFLQCLHNVMAIDGRHHLDRRQHTQRQPERRRHTSQHQQTDQRRRSWHIVHGIPADAVDPVQKGRRPDTNRAQRHAGGLHLRQTRRRTNRRSQRDRQSTDEIPQQNGQHTHPEIQPETDQQRAGNPAAGTEIW